MSPSLNSWDQWCLPQPSARMRHPCVYRAICSTAIAISAGFRSNWSSARDGKTLRPVSLPANHSSARKLGVAVAVKNHLGRICWRLTFYLGGQHHHALVMRVGDPEKGIAHAGDGVPSRAGVYGSRG